ncbi:MAG: VOC family protein [Acidimicrobiia bacterium]|nr:VOC family protein [Acidimicrobiia bacterium]
MRPSLVALAVGDEPAAWRGVGFAVDDDGCCRLGDVTVALGADGRGIRGWALDGADAAVDGLRTVEAPVTGESASVHANGTVTIDHVVVTTPDLDRTVDALVAAGLEPRRTRDAGEVTQVFFRVGGPILEVVGPTEPKPAEATTVAASARFYGLALTVADLDATAEHLGERLGRVKDAVQPGRRIATLRREAGLSTRIAVMSPEAARV